MQALQKSKKKQTIRELELCGRLVNILIERNARARKMTLRVDPTAGGTCIVIPKWGTIREAVAFAQSNEVWIINRLAFMPDPTPFIPGARIPIEGVEHEICQQDGRRAPPRCEDGALYISGDADHIPRRVEDWLKAQARHRLTDAVTHYQQVLEVRPAKITIRDTVSRWGSCSASRTLSFSWRLFLAPPEVLDYVAAHETAHLLEMNHSKKFWALVDACVEDRKYPEYWLKEKGPLLHGFGRSPI